MARASVVTLITDFGWQDAYVGQLKGRLVQTCPQALPVDLSHDIPAWDIAAAGRVLAASWHFFPAATVHLAVVDPGVGSARRLVAASGQGHFFAAPDNGLLTQLLADGVLEAAHEILMPPGQHISPTFHGRDILAPAAGRLAAGARPCELGPALPLHSLIRLPAPSVSARNAAGITGTVLSIDRFGNVRTSFHPHRDRIDTSLLYSIVLCNIVVNLRVRCYSEAPKGAYCFLVDSDGYLEVAINQGNAAQNIPCKPGDPLHLQFKTNPHEE